MTINHLTFLLDQSSNDLCLDAFGNIALASAPYAIAQDVATQLKTFRGECWYDASQGVPYWQQILGLKPPVSLIVSELETQALLVPDVETVSASIGGTTKSRNAVGQVIVTDTDSNTTALDL